MTFGQEEKNLQVEILLNPGQRAQGHAVEAQFGTFDDNLRKQITNELKTKDVTIIEEGVYTKIGFKSVDSFRGFMNGTLKECNIADIEDGANINRRMLLDDAQRFFEKGKSKNH